jgi:hypothetical protein
LLFLVLVALVGNYVETRRTNRALGALYVETMEADEHASDKMSAINDTLGESNESLEKLADLLDCIAYHRGGCGNR